MPSQLPPASCRFGDRRPVRAGGAYVWPYGKGCAVAALRRRSDADSEDSTEPAPTAGSCACEGRGESEHGVTMHRTSFSFVDDAKSENFYVLKSGQGRGQTNEEEPWSPTDQVM